MNLKKIIIEYLGLVALTIVYFLISSVEMERMLVIAVIELPITVLYVFFVELYKKHKLKTTN